MLKGTLSNKFPLRYVLCAPTSLNMTLCWIIYGIWMMWHNPPNFSTPLGGHFETCCQLKITSQCLTWGSRALTQSNLVRISIYLVLKHTCAHLMCTHDYEAFSATVLSKTLRSKIFVEPKRVSILSRKFKYVFFILNVVLHYVFNWPVHEL